MLKRIVATFGETKHSVRGRNIDPVCGSMWVQFSRRFKMNQRLRLLKIECVHPAKGILVFRALWLKASCFLEPEQIAARSGHCGTQFPKGGKAVQQTQASDNRRSGTPSDFGIQICSEVSAEQVLRILRTCQSR
jgi:hypothetical protein